MAALESWPVRALPRLRAGHVAALLVGGHALHQWHGLRPSERGPERGSLRSPALPPLQEKNARLLGAAQQLFGHCQAQKEEIRRLFQRKLDEVRPPEARAPACRLGRRGWGVQPRPLRPQKTVFSPGA